MIITIAGTYGSAGVPVAYKLAELTGYRILDDQTAGKMIKDMGITQAEFEFYDENQGMDSLRKMHAANLLDRSMTRYYSYYNAETQLPIEERFAKALKTLALEFAKDGNCIMVGRCAGYFLKPNDDLICFFTTDDMDVRIKRVMEFSVCSEETADAWNPKVVQATMGSIARVNISYTDLSTLLDTLPNDFPVYGTLLDGDDIYSQPLTSGGIIVMGNEGNGLTEKVRRRVNRRLLIPSYRTDDTAESLNVAIATAIVCAEFRRRDSACQ